MDLFGSAKFAGVALILFGILALASPLVAGESVLMVIGVLVLVGGIIRLIRNMRLGGGFWKLMLGLITIAAGGLILAHPMLASGILSILLAMYLCTDGLIEVIVAFTMKDTEGKGWLFATGILSVVLGSLLLFQAPLSGVLAIGVFLGIKLIFVGMATLALGATPHSVMKSDA